jgi:hypothetical protein
VFLLRLGFLASSSRLPLWRDIGAPDVNVLPNRPSFTGNGTDSADYAWYVFPPEKRAAGVLRTLADTPAGQRRAMDVRTSNLSTSAPGASVVERSSSNTGAVGDSLDGESR